MVDPAVQYDVRDYGAEPGGSVEKNTAGIQACIDMAKANLGGVIFFPFGPESYNFSTLDATDSTSITLRGPNHRMMGAGATLESAVSGDGIIVDARNADNFLIENLAIKYSSDQFTGVLLHMGESASGASNRSGLSQMTLASSSPPTMQTATLLNLSSSIVMTFDRVVFSGGDVAVIGLESVASGVHCNGAVFTACFFDQVATAYIHNPGTAWRFDACMFEATADTGEPRGLTGEANAGRNVTFDTCWFGDDLVAGVWIDYFGVGLTVTGCHLSATHPDTSVVRLRGRDSGLVVQGNTLRGDGVLIDARDGTESAGVSVLGNMLDVASSSTVWRDDVTTDVALWQDKEGVTHIENNV